MTVLQMIEYFDQNPDHITDTYIVVRCGDVEYKIPNYCVADLFSYLPNDWLTNTSEEIIIDTVKSAINLDSSKFVSFIYKIIKHDQDL